MHTFNEDNIRDMFLGINSKIPLIGNVDVTPINFDNAATTPAFRKVFERIKDACNCYGSIGRGLGQKSEICTKLYNDSKGYILDFFKASRNDYTAIYVNNTTDGINKLSNILITNKEDVVITTRMEHHSNDLPWRAKAKVDYIEVDKDGRLIVNELEEKLTLYNGQVKYVSITAASNVTGYVNDIREIARIVHKYGAMLIVDGAQIVAHRRIYLETDIPEESIDFFVFSAHKIYAPFGCGVIIGRKDIFNRMDSDYKGGGAVKAVYDDREILLNTPEKNEVGSPNFFGVIALVEALKQLENIEFENIIKHEEGLLNRALDRMKNMSRIKLYGDSINREDRLGIIIFNIDGIYHEDVAKILAKFRGIAVRQGAFCAHPYVNRLLKLSEKEAYKYVDDDNYKMPGMVRVSFGVYNTLDEVDIFLDTLEWLSKF